MKKSGFTLIELMVAISIVAILSAIGLTLFTSVQKSARDAKRREELQSIAKALEQYKLANGAYPVPDGWCTTISNGTYPQVQNALSTYFANGSVPTDPKYSGLAGDYWYTGTPTGFEIGSTLESPGSTPEVSFTHGSGCSNWTTTVKYYFKLSNQI